VELAAGVAANDDDPAFAPDAVKHAAENLFTSIQGAWTRDDRIALRGLVAPGLLQEWERRLDDFRSRGWSNHVEVLAPPEVQYVGLANRGKQDSDQVTVRIDARLRDYVVDRNGRHIKQSGQLTETTRTREYWTLQRRNDHWILASIEQGAEGSHALKDRIVASELEDDQTLRDEALVEGAVAEAVPAGTNIAELAALEYDGDARAAANDLSVADGRFAPDVLEVAARRAVDAWARAVDGDAKQLLAIADRGAAQELLHPGDPSGRTRLVVRGPQVSQIRIHALDAAADPPTMTIDVDLTGRRYIQDRDTAAVLSGSQNRAVNFTERWTLALTGDEAQPWRIVAVDTPVGLA
jgi:predicted lipid-binding transport protein (Tim44 family)